MGLREHGNALALHVAQRVFTAENVTHGASRDDEVEGAEGPQRTVLAGLGRSNDTANGCWSQAGASSRERYGIIAFRMRR